MPRRPLTNPKGKPLTLGALHPNCGIEAQYKAKLFALVEQMNRSIVYFLTAAYRATPPLAQDDDMPALSLTAEMRRLGDRWTDRFDHAAPELGRWFALAAKDRSDAALADTLRRAGFSVKFQMTAPARDVFNATAQAQVGLIRSIATEHLAEVQGMVMRSVQTGRDTGTLAKELRERFDITKRRAALIAQHQNNMATATITRVRQLELGIVTAGWLHSGGGRHPRPSHVKASRDGVIYDVEKGWYDPEAKVWTWPGVLIGCRCVPRSIVPGID